MIKVKDNWWKDYFNHIYLITDARSVCDADLTKKEVALIEKLLNLEKDDSIIDLCGGEGRHSLELARRGYKKLSVLDYSPYLVSRGRRLARKENAGIKFYKRDARATGLKNDEFQAVFLMANSFGYFDSELDDITVLKEIKRLLAKGGRLLLDLADLDYIRRNLKPRSQHNAGGDITVYRQRELIKNKIKAKEIVVSRKKGIIRDGSYSERLYTDKKIKSVLEAVGYKDVSVRKGVELHKKKKDHGFLTSRMMVTARKG